MMMKMSYRKISILFAAFLILLMVVLRYVNPTGLGEYIRCPVNKYLGLQCPGCGALRALHCIVHGDFVGALRFNMLCVIMLPVLFISLLMGSVSGEDKLFTHKRAVPFIKVFLIVLVLFSVLRNIL